MNDAEAIPPHAHDDRYLIVVEDEDALREATTRMLVRHGYDILVCANGPEALALADLHYGTLGLLITDVVMPQMGGIELAKRMRETREGLPVLFMSGYTLSTRGFEFGGTSALLQKPFTERQLLAQVRALLAPTRRDPAGRSD